MAPILVLVPGPALAQDNILLVARTQEEVVLDGIADEAAWGEAIPAHVEVTRTTFISVELRALYDDTNIYFYAKWEDPSKSIIPQQWQYTGGAWYSAPHKEDRLAMLWNTDDAIVGFEQNKQGCSAACHNDVFKTQSAEEMGDLWQWLAARTNPSNRNPDVGWMDDRSLGSQGIEADDFTGSFIWQANSIYAHDQNGSTVPFAANDTPKWWEPPKTDAEFLFRGTEAEITPSDTFENGDVIPGYLLSRPATGKDRADIEAKGKYDDTKKVWTLEWKRKLVTGFANDVAFDDLTNTYYFGLAIFDNQAGGKNTHYRSDLVTLRFDLPDLSVLSVAATPTTPVIGDTINVSAKVKNLGGYSTGFTVAAYLDNMTNEPFFTRPYADMTPGLEDEFNLTWDSADQTPGKHTIYLKTDSDGIIPEHNEANNVRSIDVWVYPPIVKFKANKKEPEEGQKVKITASIENPSDVNASITVVFYEDSNVIDTQIVNVTPGETLDVTTTWKASKKGKYTFMVELEGAVNTQQTLKVEVKEASPGPSVLLAALAIGAAAGLAIRRRR